MSFNYFVSGMYGVDIEELFPKSICVEVYAAWSAAQNNWDENLRVRAPCENLTKYQDRYAKILATRKLSEFADNPEDFVAGAFKKDCEQYIPDFKKICKFTHFARVDGDSLGGSVLPDTILFGIGMYSFPLERNYKRAKLPKSFMDQAAMLTWVTGG